MNQIINRKPVMFRLVVLSVAFFLPALFAQASDSTRIMRQSKPVIVIDQAMADAI